MFQCNPVISQRLSIKIMRIRHWSKKCYLGMEKKEKRVIHIYIHLQHIFESMAINKKLTFPLKKTWQGGKQEKSKFLPALHVVICNWFKKKNFLSVLVISLCGVNNADAEMSYLPLLCLLLFSYLPCLAGGCLSSLRRCSISVVAGRRYLWVQRV